MAYTNPNSPIWTTEKELKAVMESYRKEQERNGIVTLTVNKSELETLALALRNELSKALPYQHLLPTHYDSVSKLLSLVMRKQAEV